jgi:hypothetical protein
VNDEADRRDTGAGAAPQHDEQHGHNRCAVADARRWAFAVVRNPSGYYQHRRDHDEREPDEEQRFADAPNDRRCSLSHALTVTRDRARRSAHQGCAGRVRKTEVSP